MQDNAARAMDKLKLIALDEEDLAVVSVASSGCGAARRRHGLSAVEEALRRRAQPLRLGEGRAARTAASSSVAARRSDSTACLGAQAQAPEAAPQDRVLSLLAVSFEPAEPPGGHVRLTFSGDASIRLEVECIEAELKDLGPAWSARLKPKHPGLESVEIDEVALGRKPAAGELDDEGA